MVLLYEMTMFGKTNYKTFQMKMLTQGDAWNRKIRCVFNSMPEKWTQRCL